MIKAITKRDLIKSIPDRFSRQYAHYDPARPAPWSKRSRSIADVIAALHSLDTEACTEADVFEAIESNWTRHACDECQTDSDVLVRIGNDDDYDAPCVDVCTSCLAKALRVAS